MDKEKYTSIITDNDEIASYVVIVDENGNKINHIKSYDVETKEAELYCVDENGRIKTEWISEQNLSMYRRYIGDEAGRFVPTEKKILIGSKIMFKK